MNSEEIADLESRLRRIITTKCNTHGCKECDLKNYLNEESTLNKTCAMTDLQDRIYELEIDKDRNET